MRGNLKNWKMPEFIFAYGLGLSTCIRVPSNILLNLNSLILDVLVLYYGDNNAFLLFSGLFNFWGHCNLYAPNQRLVLNKPSWRMLHSGYERDLTGFPRSGRSWHDIHSSRFTGALNELWVNIELPPLISVNKGKYAVAKWPTSEILKG